MELYHCKPNATIQGQCMVHTIRPVCGL